MPYLSLKKELHFSGVLTLGLMLILSGFRNGHAGSNKKNLAVKPLQNLLSAEESLKKGEYEGTVKGLKLILSEDPANTKARLDLALAYLKLKNYQSSVDECRIILKTHPEEGVVHYVLGTVYYEMGNWDDAISSFKQSARLEPSLTANSHFNMGMTYFMARLGIMAKKEFSKVINMESSTELRDEARRVMDSIERGSMDTILKQEGQVSYSRGIEKFNRGDYKGAGREFEQASVASPNEAAIHYYLGYTYYKLGNYPAALNSLDAARVLKPEEGKFIFFSGIAALQAGDEGRAEMEFKKAIAGKTKYRDAAVRYLDLIKEARKSRKRWRLSIDANGQSDSNVTLFSSGDQTSQESDTLLNTTLLGEYKFINRPDLTLGARYIFYQDQYRDLKEFDFQGHFGRVYTRYKIDPLVLGFEYERYFYYLDDKPYQTSNKITPGITFTETRNLFAKMELSYQWINAKGSDYDYLEGIRRTASLSQYFYFMNRKGLLTLSYKYTEEDLNDRTGTQPFLLGRKGFRPGDPYLPPTEEQGTEDLPFFQSYSYSGHEISARLSLPLIFGISLNLTGEYLIRNYSSDDQYMYHDQRPFDTRGRPNFIKTENELIPVLYENRTNLFREREDHRFTYSIEISREIFDYLKVSLRYRDITNNSNIGKAAPTDRNYDRNAFYLTFNVNF